MEKTADTVKPDITEEPYKGTGGTIASLGYGFLDFKIATALSLLAGVGTAFLAPKQATQALEEMSKGSLSWKASDSLIKRTIGGAGNAWLSAGTWATDHLPFSKKIQEYITPNRWKSGSKIAGMIAAPSFFLTAFSGTSRGIASANNGRNQFNRAKQEIKDLRAENAALRNKNAELVARDIVEEHQDAALKSIATDSKNLPTTTIAPASEREITPLHNAQEPARAASV